MKEKIIIKAVNPEIQKIILEFLYSKGFYWAGCKTPTPVFQYIYLNENNCRDLTHWTKPNRNRKVFDAETQLGEIVKFFDKPIIEVENILGNKITVTFGLDTISLGLVRIDKSLLAGLEKVFSVGTHIDTKRIEKIQIGNFIFTPDTIKQITSHPDFQG